MRGVSRSPTGVVGDESSAEEIVINRSESRLIALERRNQAARSKKKAARVAKVDTSNKVETRSANDEGPGRAPRTASAT